MATLSPPTSPQAYDHRPRPVTNASYMSNRSRRSSGSTNKLELTETANEKRRLQAKSDPRMALNEAQPASVALEDASIDNLRASRYKDFEGNVIADPDRSNPTRYRLERPLDTIRSFHAAAEGTSTRRYSSHGSSHAPDSGNRRSSYYGNGMSSPQQRSKPNGGGYYRNSSYGYRPDQVVEEGGLPQPPFGRPPRQQGQPYYSNGESPSSHAYQQSYETVTSGSDEYGKSTNPSSQNSSFDRLHQLHNGRKPEEHNTPFDGDAQYIRPTTYGDMRYPSHGHNDAIYQPHPQSNGPLPAANNPRKPMKLDTGVTMPQGDAADFQKANPSKRQSWIKRKFSRRDS